MTTLLEISIHDGVAILSLNRPERRNAITPELRNQLGDALEAFGNDSTVRAIVIRGNGQTFCGGGDIGEMKQLQETHAARSRMERVGHVADLLISGPKPIVACVEGAAYGAGLAIVAACDYVVATPDARFCAPFANLGLVADWGLTWTLRHRVGAARAKRMILLAEVIDAAEAQAAGLADEICAPGEAMPRALAVAEKAASMPPLATAHMRKTFAMPLTSPREALNFEAAAQAELLQTDDHREGVEAFFAKRRSQFSGT